MIRANSGNYFKIRQCLNQWQQEAVCKAAKAEITRYADDWNRRIAAGLPAFDEAVFPLALAADALVNVSDIIEKQLVSHEKAQYLIKSYLQSKTCEEVIAKGLSDNQLRMYIHLVCLTVMNIMAENIYCEEVSQSWLQNICPACGSAPALAYYDDNGKRKLVCGTCITHWQFKRLGCAVCDEENHNNIQIVKCGNDFPGWSVQVCKTCYSYLKVADLRELDQTPDWIVANVSTLPMDFTAEKWLSENF
ncbi:formate dehydrogenase accessory protein FdhE [Sporomusa sp.]|uniref:formate dehydrogenase accessory protein FdhE n=1 Tax=Sporomusa sp. TaxID=2078658 RepID=UPI002C8DA17E|nr:formate dehydrogenase accessory protein FdhE [Sporomusa sp.]HWR05545.1 formate dehydrogenase accessory protein FdhE [Sporomusa sp.]